MFANAAYVKGIWSARYFWFHLALSDIRFKYRRSLLGLAWAVIQPLSMTLLLAFIMGNLFHAPMEYYAPFIFSGIVIWEFITSSTLNGCMAFIGAEGYIRQFSHPLLIYTLRVVIPCLINLLFAFAGLIIWILFWKPSHFGWSWSALLLAFPLLFLLAWPLCTMTAFIGARFRDLSQLLVILLQAVYYISPIMFLPKVFYMVNIQYLLEYNPVYHLLNLFRKPLLEGVFPAIQDFNYVIVSILICWFFAWILIRRAEQKIIFYL